MSFGITPGTAAFGRDRLASAEAFLTSAERTAQAQLDRFATNVAITNFVHAGIAASDAICCFELRSYMQGDDHRQAIGHLAKVGPDGSALSKALGDLLAMKSTASYGAKPLPPDDLKRAARAAAKLVAAARARL